MNLDLYTDKTVAQCIGALSERLQGSGGKYKLDGWVEKNGSFALSMESAVIPRLSDKIRRRTQLRGKVTRESGQTVIACSVPDGVTPIARIWIYGALIVLGLAMIAIDELLFALLLIPIGIVMYVPMKGDYTNYDLLVSEVSRILKAKDKPLVTPPTKPAPARSASGAKPTNRASTTAKPTSASARPKSTAKAPSASSSLFED